jgi:hypothetical protein
MEPTNDVSWVNEPRASEDQVTIHTIAISAKESTRFAVDSLKVEIQPHARPTDKDTANDISLGDFVAPRSGKIPALSPVAIAGILISIN